MRLKVQKRTHDDERILAARVSQAGVYTRSVV